MEPPMEARIARLEADAARLRADVGDIKADLRTLCDGMDARMDRFEARLGKLNGRERLARSSFGTPVADLLAFKVLAFVIYLVCTAVMFGGLAHGFGWI
jgi:hypothetical protein